MSAKPQLGETAGNTDIYSVGDGHGLAPEIQMLRLASGHIVARAIHVFASLGIADLLRAGALDVQEIAKRTDTHSGALLRLLHFLGTVEVVHQEADGCFSLTALGKTLCSKPSPGVRDYALMFGSPTFWAMYGDFRYSVQTGKSAFEHIFGEHYFQYLAGHPEEAELFNAAMQSSARMGVATTVAEYPFSNFQKIVDVGGGEGGLLTGILKRYPSVRGYLFDTPSVVRRAQIDPALAGRMDVAGGNFLKRIPARADAYILRRILHDWNDQMAGQILRVIRRAIPEHGKLLIMELSAPGPGESANNWCGVDLMMMLNFDGRERNEPELRVLLESAGFRLTRVIRTNSPHWIVEAIPV